MEYLSSLWRSADFLKSASAFLQWGSIVLIFFGGFLQIGKYFIDRQEKDIIRKEQEKSRQEQQAKVSSLEGEISEHKIKIVDLNKANETSDSKVKELSNPYIKPIRTGTVTVEVTIESSENKNAHFMDQGGYFGLGKGSTEIVTLGASNCWVRKTGDKESTYRGIYNLDAFHKVIGKPVYNLKNAEYVQIVFVPMPKDVKVLRGNAIFTINDTVQMRLNIPAHQANGDKIIVPNISEMFREFHK